ncbi:hypothetical protein HYN46_06850 [Aquirhabdus parva]|uniref:DUF2157 domain-containing protein n=2 Tax=Aquirhabdus parva TaxID=2283318 RepID=A0A345P5K9_9GAMM|nr:hypothetical protein HYN46_06850 [Aquirhabdus parva]
MKEMVQGGAMSAFTADSIEIVNNIWHKQSILLIILLLTGLGLGLLWRKGLRIEDISWIIVVIILTTGFACVLLRVKLGL